MATALTTSAIEQSTYVVVASFTDEDGNAVVPNTVTWSLTSPTGTIINSRENVSATPAATVNIVLKGNDLLVADGLSRLLTITAAYDSSLGTGLPLIESCIFHLENLVAIS